MVVCDDGSTDETLAVLANFASTAPFPVHVHQNSSRLGFADNFLKAASLCKAPFIAFCDQDDVWRTDKLARCTDYLACPGVMVVVHSAKLVDATLQPLPGRYPGIRRTRVAPPLDLDPWFAPPGFAMVFDASLLDMADDRRRPRCHTASVDVPKPHDQWIAFVGSVLGHTALLGDDLCLYRQHDANTIGEKTERGLELLRSSSNAGWLQYRRMTDLAREYADYCEHLTRGRSGIAAARLAAGAEHYRNVAGLWALRARLYERGQPPGRRVVRFAAIARRQGYRRRDAAGLGARALVKDIAFAAAGSAVVREPSQP